MGRKDLQKKSYFHDAERFADLINGLLCSGRQMLTAADLTEPDAYDVIAEYTETNELMKVRTYNGDGKVDMCKAITELIEKGRRAGLE